jgi:predicted RNA-binding Zn-ribbon protein involved in translation (DUF1610 family)
MQLQLHIFRLQYSFERSCPAIGDTSTIQCLLYCKFGVKYSAHRPVYAVWTVVPGIHKVFTAPHIYASIFNWMHLRCYWRYHDNSMLVILQTWCQIQRTSSSFRCVNCGTVHIQNIYSSAYSGFKIQLDVSALQLEISLQFNARYSANLKRNTAHILQIILCVLWSRTCTIYLQLHIFILQYSFERICPAIGDITTIQCALYSKPCAKYSAHPPVYAVWTVVPAIYNVLTAPHSQATILNWTYLRCNRRYSDTSMRVTLQIWCLIQRTSSSLRCVNCGPGHIQSICSSAYICFNIQL